MDKKAAILTIDDKKKISLSFHPLKPLRDMREIECSLEELLKKECEIGCQEDYMHVILTDEEQILDAIGKVRTVYPNVMQISFKNRRHETDGICPDERRSDFRSKSDGVI
ncbi:MAG: exonuclease SbcCD subunit D C-terminal domain-containing protein [Anaerostipes hadrus]